jgi:hypothetical protein
MKSSYLINLGLIILLTGLYWFNNLNTDQTTPINKLTNADSKTVDLITISQVNRTKIVLEKIAGQWQLIAPLTAQANLNRINLLLSLLTMKTDRQQTVTQGQNIKPFGLTESSTELTLGYKHFKFGNIEPISKQRYVLHNNVIYLLEDRVSPLLNTHASSFIDNRLISEKKNITAIELPMYQAQSLSNQTITLELINGHWKTEQNIAPDKLVELIDNWRFASALQVIPLDSIAAKLGTASAYANLILDDQESMQLALYLNNTSFFIINEKAKLAYQFPKALSQTLLLPVPAQ